MSSVESLSSERTSLVCCEEQLKSAANKTQGVGRLYPAAEKSRRLLPGDCCSFIVISALCIMAASAWAIGFRTTNTSFSSMLMSKWHSKNFQNRTIGGLPISSDWVHEDWHSQNDTIGSLPIHSYWFDIDDSGCRRVSEPAVVTSIFGGMAAEHASLPSCVSEAYSPYDDLLKEPSMQEAKSRLGVDALFVIHYPKLVDRKGKIEKFLSEQGLASAATWVEWDGLFSQLGQDASKLCCIFDCQSEWWRTVENGTKDLSLRHLFAIYQVYKLSLDRAVIIEDDAVVVGQFNVSTVVRGLARQSPADTTMIMLGGTKTWRACNNSHSLAVDQHYLVGPGYGARTAGAYLITLAGAKNILGKIFARGHGVNNPADLIMDGAINIGCYWLEPPLMNQTEGGGAGHPAASSRHHS